MVRLSRTLHKQAGISLIEVVIGLTLISIVAGYSLPHMQQTGRAMIVNDQVQTATQLVQACSEHVLALRSNEALFGYGTIDTTTCSTLPTVNGFTTNIAIT